MLLCCVSGQSSDPSKMSSSERRHSTSSVITSAASLDVDEGPVSARQEAEEEFSEAVVKALAESPSDLNAELALEASQTKIVSDRLVAVKEKSKKKKTKSKDAKDDDLLLLNAVIANPQHDPTSALPAESAGSGAGLAGVFSYAQRQLGAIMKRKGIQLLRKKTFCSPDSSFLCGQPADQDVLSHSAAFFTQTSTVTYGITLQDCLEKFQVTKVVSGMGKAPRQKKAALGALCLSDQWKRSADLLAAESLSVDEEVRRFVNKGGIQLLRLVFHAQSGVFSSSDRVLTACQVGLLSALAGCLHRLCSHNIGIDSVLCSGLGACIADFLSFLALTVEHIHMLAPTDSSISPAHVLKITQALGHLSSVCSHCLRRVSRSAETKKALSRADAAHSSWELEIASEWEAKQTEWVWYLFSCGIVVKMMDIGREALTRHRCGQLEPVAEVNSSEDCQELEVIACTEIMGGFLFYLK